MTNEPLRDVLLDNKQTVYGVPDEITDEEVKDAYKQNDKDSILEDVKDYFTSKQNIDLSDVSDWFDTEDLIEDNFDDFTSASTSEQQTIKNLERAIENQATLLEKIVDFCDDDTIDICGVCGGSGSIYYCGCNPLPDGACDCDGNILDCQGVCGGSSSLDDCGDCDGGNAAQDCAGVCNGPNESDGFGGPRIHGNRDKH